MPRADSWRGTARCWALTKLCRGSTRARKKATGRRMTAKKQSDGRPAAAPAPDIVIITGLSGSGMSSATNAFEDLGYFCVDNLPLTLLPTFARLVRPQDRNRPHIERAPLVINIREGRFLNEFPSRLAELRESGLRVFVLFFEASDED